MLFEDRDLELAILTRRFLTSMGFFAQLKVPLFVPIYGKMFKRSPASDIDVLGIKFDPDFEVTVAVAEAKSSEQKALDELLKIKAIAEYLKASKRYLVKSQIHENAREIGRQLGVVCFNSSEIVQMLTNLAVNYNVPSPEELLHYRQQKAWFIDMRKEKQAQSLANYLESEVWSRVYWENLNNLIYLLRNFLNEFKVKPQPFTEFTVFKTACVISLSINYLCRQIICNSLSNIDRGVELFVFGGPAARRQRERLRDEIQRVTPSLKGLSITLEPLFIGDLKEIVAYFMLSPREAVLTPHVFDEVVCIIAASGGSFNPSKWSSNHHPIAVKLAKDIFQFLIKSCGHTDLSQSQKDFINL